MQSVPLLVIREPRVSVLARQEFVYPEHIRWQSDSDVPGQVLAEFAGRLCYLSFGEDAGLEGGHKTIGGRTTNESYLANILGVKHGSVLEHAVWSLLLEGVSRALTHELVRHRAGFAFSQLSQRYVDESNILGVKHGSVLEHAVWSLLLEGVSRALTHELVRHRAGFAFSQLSQRYVDESNIAFVLPPEIEEGSRAYELWLGACEGSLNAYRELLEELTEQIGDTGTATMRKKRARQAARAVLPNAAETKIVVTGNARAWRHFVEMRGSASADVEIRRLAVAVLRTLHQESPNIFGDMRIIAQHDGTEVVETANSKV